jgi:hypothetical protein
MLYEVSQQASLRVQCATMYMAVHGRGLNMLLRHDNGYEKRRACLHWLHPLDDPSPAHSLQHKRILQVIVPLTKSILASTSHTIGAR